MTYYATISSTNLDEQTEYEGIDIKKAIQAYERAINYTQRNVEIRVYTLPDDTDINDRDELINAICDAMGYGLLR